MNDSRVRAARRFTAVAGIALLAATQAACSGGDDGESAAPSTSSTSEPAPSTEPAQTPDPTPGEPDTAVEDQTSSPEEDTQAEAPAETGDDGGGPAFTTVDFLSFPAARYLSEHDVEVTDENLRVFMVKVTSGAFDLQCTIGGGAFACTAPAGWEFCEEVGVGSGVGMRHDDPTRLAGYCPGEGFSTDGAPRYLEPMQRVADGNVECVNADATLTCRTLDGSVMFTIEDGRIAETVPLVESSTIW